MLAGIANNNIGTMILILFFIPDKFFTFTAKDKTYVRDAYCFSLKYRVTVPVPNKKAELDT